MLALFIVVFVLFKYYAWHSINIRNKKNFDYNFAGIVENVTYDEKLIPSVTVHNRTYYLDTGYNFGQEIGKGDSIIKKRSSPVYKLIKSDGKILTFTNE